MGYASFVPEPAADWYVTPPNSGRRVHAV